MNCFMGPLSFHECFLDELTSNLEFQGVALPVPFCVGANASVKTGLRSGDMLQYQGLIAHNDPTGYVVVNLNSLKTKLQSQVFFSFKGKCFKFQRHS